jgi:hypothetical protein
MSGYSWFALDLPGAPRKIVRSRRRLRVAIVYPRLFERPALGADVREDRCCAPLRPFSEQGHYSVTFKLEVVCRFALASDLAGTLHPQDWGTFPESKKVQI